MTIPVGMDPVPEGMPLVDALVVYAEAFLRSDLPHAEAVTRLVAIAGGDGEAMRAARRKSFFMQSPPDWTPEQWEIVGRELGMRREPYERQREDADRLFADAEAAMGLPNA